MEDKEERTVEVSEGALNQLHSAHYFSKKVSIFYAFSIKVHETINIKRRQ